MKSNNYNFIAPFYDQITRLVFCGSIQKAQLAHLNLLPDEGRILFIGGGTGFALREILKLKPNLTIDYVDHSIKMIELSKEKIKHLKPKQVNFINGNESTIPNLTYDGIISFFYFDILLKKEREVVFTKMYNQLKVDGIWLFADFLQAKNWYEKILEFAMYTFLKYSTNLKISQIPHLNSLIGDKKLRLKAESTFYNEFIFSCSYLKSNWNNS